MRRQTAGEILQAEALREMEKEENREQSWFVALLRHQPTRQLLRQICAHSYAGDLAGFPRHEPWDYVCIGKRQVAQEYIDKIVKYGTADDIAELIYGKVKA